MKTNPGIVYLLDDEPGMLRAVGRLLRSEGFNVEAFSSVKSFLDACRPAEICCLVLDVSMPELDGMELHRRLTRAGILIPIVFLTGFGNIPMSVRAIKEGAVDFLTKPVNDMDLLLAVRTALKHAAEKHNEIAEAASLAKRYAILTPREQEVMSYVIAGKLNKQIAAHLGTGEQNIKIHRSRVFEKMSVDSVAGLVRAAQCLGIKPQDGTPGSRH
ncbi:MAG TPA: response regulator [Verrucomicrobiales bacterium]|nr:response regulator [Verrucomicrobiales bacterium]